MCSAVLITNFLNSILQGILVSALYESGQDLVSQMTGKKSIEGRYKKAFENAICRFYADPKYAGNEARKEYEYYREALKHDCEANDLLEEESGRYKKLLDLFKEEAYKDKHLQRWTWFRILCTSSNKLNQIRADQQTIIKELVDSRKENKCGFESVSRSLAELVKNVSALQTMPNVSVIPSDLSIAKCVDKNNSHLCLRSNLVTRCVNIIKGGKVLVLYGSVRVGKGTLAEMVISYFPEGRVIKNVPSADLDLAVRVCVRERQEGKVIILTTEAPLCVNMALYSGLVEQVNVPLLTEEETRELINTYSPPKDYSRFIYAHSSGHPVLVKALCTYLSSCNWVVDEAVFGKMLSYSFDHQLSRTLAEMMLRMIPDPDSRSLLNRMMLVKNAFNMEDVLALANVPPIISDPKSRLLVLQPGWVSEENGVYKVTPLYDKVWTPDMSKDCYIACNWLLASRVLSNKKTLGEQDVLHYILYAQNAGHYEDAGRMFLKAMNSVTSGDVKKLLILPSMWVDTPLPKQMSERLRIVIRIQQLLLFDDLSAAKKDFLLKDLCQLVDSSEKGEWTSAFYNAVCVLCWMENQMQMGMHYYNQALSTRNHESKCQEEMREMEELFKAGAWFLPLRFTCVAEFDTWLDSMGKRSFEYDHSDSDICECCYLSLFHLVNCVWEDRDLDAIQMDLHVILSKSLSCNCPEMAASAAFEMMELYSKAGQYNDARRVYDENYELLMGCPLAIVLLNGSRAFSIYADKSSENRDALSYIQMLKAREYEDIIPNIHLHMRQIESYIIGENNVNEGISLMKETIDYVQRSNHSKTPYEYYQCLGELSFFYWRAGERDTAVEIVSECVAYVTSKVGLESPFAKTYLCLCGLLLAFYLCELQGKQLPEEQVTPFTGMFTEIDPRQLDNQYSKDRIYISSYLLYQLCDELRLDRLKNEWAYKVLGAVKCRGENKEIHYMVTLMIPEFLKKPDFEAVAQVSDIANASQALAYENQPKLRRESVDSEHVEFIIIPALIEALRLAIAGDRRGIERVYGILSSYRPITKSNVIEQVLSVFNRETYDMSFINDIQALDINTFYPVYFCAYLFTALSVNATQAFMLIMSIIIRLENDLVKVMGDSIKEVLNRFVSSFWKARIMTSPEEFRDSAFLASKGLKLIEDYNGKMNQANHTMMIVRTHLLQEVRMNEMQEKWLDT